MTTIILPNTHVSASSPSTLRCNGMHFRLAEYTSSNTLQLSLDELRNMVGREGQTFSNRVSTVSESTKTFLYNSYLLFTKVSLHVSISHSLCTTVHNWGERERAPSCGLNGRAVTIDIYIYRYIDRRAYVHRYCACAALRANVAGQIGNRFSPAESAFSACIGSRLVPRPFPI